jgi:Protein of unknown function (DUF998)
MMTDDGQMSGGVGAVAGVVTLVALVVALVALVVLHVLPTGLSPRKNPVSQYGITRYRMGYRVQTIAFGIAGIAAAIGLAGSGSAGFGDVAHLGPVVALLLLFAVARLVISWFPMDEPGVGRTQRGRMHGLLAIITFVAITLAAARFGTVLGRAGERASVAAASQAIGWTLVGSIVAMMIVGRAEQSRSYFGAVERLFYLATAAWFVVLGVALLTHR